MMKNIKLFIGMCLLGLCSACHKYENPLPEEIALKGKLQLNFDLLEVPDGATGVKLTPTLSWEPLKHPKGGSITYDLYLGTSSKAPALYESDITGTIVEITNKLQLITTYYWKVIAKDGEGMRIVSKPRKFSTRGPNFPSDPEVENAEFSGRTGHTSVVFDGKMWVIGGYDTESKNDVWYSENGTNWTQANPSAPFSGRVDHTSIVFDNKMWVIGGFDGEWKNDIWSSVNGVDWEEVVGPIPFEVRHGHTSVVFNDELWVLGGYDGNAFQTPLNDVWHSANGMDWELATASADFPARLKHSSVVFDNKMWVIGGQEEEAGAPTNDVWYSVDGVNWTEAMNTIAFSARLSHTTAVFDDKIWLIAGRNEPGAIDPTDVWYSDNGTDWQLAEEDFLLRYSHTSLAFDDKLWVIAGIEGGVKKNDVWALD